MHPLFLEEMGRARHKELLRTAEKRRSIPRTVRSLRSFPRLRRALGRTLVDVGFRLASSSEPDCEGGQRA
jgi:hypothetical protein